jgi:hypothetical protein
MTSLPRSVPILAIHPDWDPDFSNPNFSDPDFSDPDLVIRF